MRVRPDRQQPDRRRWRHHDGAVRRFSGNSPGLHVGAERVHVPQGQEGLWQVVAAHDEVKPQGVVNER